MDTLLRRATPADVAPLALLWRAFMEEMEALDDRFALAEDAPVRWRNDVPHWLRNERRRLFVAEGAAGLVGYASAQRWSPPPIYEHSPEIYLDELYVVPAARRQGLARQLFAEVTAWGEALKATRIRLGALAQNPTAAAFWHTLGAMPFSTTYTLPLSPSAPAPSSPPSRIIGF